MGRPGWFDAAAPVPALRGGSGISGPGALWRRATRGLASLGEPELRLVPALADPERISVDVGSKAGLYAAVMARHSARTLAVEPNPRLLPALRRRLPASVEIGGFALSDRCGPAELLVPAFRGRGAVPGRASIEPGNRLEGHRRVDRVAVEARTLDSLSLGPVGLLKVDVEGHELAVLRGARETLGRDRPSLIVESEARHHPGFPEAVFGFLADLGYRGGFLYRGRLLPLAAFDRARHQNPRRAGRFGPLPGSVYVNNFVFVPDEAALRRLAAVVPPAGAPALNATGSG